MSFPCRILCSAKQRRSRPGLDDAYDGIDFQKPQSKLTRSLASAGLALSVIASRCHLSQSERPWQSAKFPVWNLYALLPQGEPKALRSDFSPLPRAPPLGKTPSGRREMSHVRQREDSWREAPERASPLPGPLDPSLAGDCGGRWQARWRRDSTSPLFYHFLKKISKSS